jgi:predicted flap endonuclease-1-like 5' DNA nuclease
MSALLILIVQTRFVATIEILLLLLGAASIGYLTAWYFYKTIYLRRIKAVESEKDDLMKVIVDHNTAFSKMQKSLQDKDHEIQYFIKKVYTYKELYQQEKDEALIHIAQRKHLLNYNSFGTATKEEQNDLKMISGIGPFIEERLHAVDIFTFKQISKFTAHDIESMNEAIEYFTGRIERDEWIAQAKELVNLKEKRTELLKKIKEKKERIYYNTIGTAQKEEADDLSTISGIGGWIREKLHALDIYTFRQIGNFTDKDIHAVTEAIEYFPGRIERDEWIEQAKELVTIGGKKTELLQRIEERKGRIYFDRLGVAHKHRANNLTLIRGIGLWIEERLNMLDLYTFKQISNLTPADVEIITEILEIAPGRIDRDNWVDQARDLSNNVFISQ